MTNLVGAHSKAMEDLRAGGESNVFNCGYGQGFSILQVIDAVKRASGGTVGLVIGHVGPEAALSGPIAFFETATKSWSISTKTS